MAYQFFQISVGGQSETVEALKKLVRGGRIASVGRLLLADTENAFFGLLRRIFRWANGHYH
jgi:hypothetical protein